MMNNINDYLVDWAEQVRSLASQQTDHKTRKKLVALAEECGRITLLMEPEREITRLNRGLRSRLLHCAPLFFKALPTPLFGASITPSTGARDAARSTGSSRPPRPRLLNGR